MAQINEVCTTCSAPTNAVFDPTTGTRESVVIGSDLLVTEQCFVRDTITFLNTGRLIFAPTGNEKEKKYFDSYNVVCRKLVIIGGGKPGDAAPCDDGAGGSLYSGKNVITWFDRLHRAPNGTTMPQASMGQTFDPNVWEDQGQGNDGKDGGRGGDGKAGFPGGLGRDAPRTLNIVALEVVMGGLADQLIIDWNGQAGGNGGTGQRGGDGGRGMGGRDGVVDESWTGDSCGSQPGDGGNGGDGGKGGGGGKGGDGGKGGAIWIVSTAANVGVNGPFVTGGFHYVYSGDNHGEGGDGGKGGKGAFQGAGHKGKNSGPCDQDAENGTGGNPGLTDPTADGGPGAAGADGASGSRQFEPIAPPSTGTCADKLPLALKLDTVVPAAGARNSSVPVVLTGIGFKPAAALHLVEVGGLGVTASSVVVVSDTQINCNLDITPAAATSARDITVTVNADSVTKAGAFTVA